jgi:hypothetical protein
MGKEKLAGTQAHFGYPHQGTMSNLSTRSEMNAGQARSREAVLLDRQNEPQVC